MARLCSTCVRTEHLRDSVMGIKCIKQKARPPPPWHIPSPAGLRQMQRTGEGQPCGAGARPGAGLAAIIHYSLGIAQTILFEQGISGESRVHLGLPPLLCPCSERLLHQLQGGPQGGTRAPGLLRTRLWPGASAQALKPPYHPRLQVQTARDPESWLL